MGFLDGGTDTPQNSAAIAQLARLFGQDALAPLETYSKDWRSDRWTSTSADREPLTTHPAYGIPNGAKTLEPRRLLLSGTESAPYYGGYMEGALEASENVLAKLL